MSEEIQKKRFIEQVFCIHKNLTETYTGPASEYYHTRRMILDPIIFNYLREKYLSTFRAYWVSCTIPKQSDKAICIVERRYHPNLEFCLLNAAYFARGYSIYIFCSHENFEFIQKICEPHINTIHIQKVFNGFGTPEEGKREYNQLLVKSTFWESIDADYILTIETDTYLLNFIPESISDFDYVASKWIWDLNAPGGGGLSFRKKSMMVELCKNTDKEDTVDYMQDSFVSNGVKKYGFTYPDVNISKHLFVESDLYSEPIGIHQWWTFLNDDICLSYSVINKFTTLNIDTE